jgi:hypothetical protein
MVSPAIPSSPTEWCRYRWLSGKITRSSPRHHASRSSERDGRQRKSSASDDEVTLAQYERSSEYSDRRECATARTPVSVIRLQYLKMKWCKSGACWQIDNCCLQCNGVQQN